MKLQRNWQLFKDTFALLRSPLQLAYPTLLEFSFLLVYFLLFWFIFAPLFYNNLGALLEIAQQVRGGSLDVGLQTAFSYALYDVLKILALFIFSIYLTWCFFCAHVWKWLGTQLRKKTDNLLVPFSLVTLVYAVYALFILLPTARLSFFFPAQGQLILLTIGAFLVLISFHFAIISYAQLLRERNWWKAIRSALWVGFKSISTFSFSYILVLGYVVALEILLRAIDWFLGQTVYLVLGLLLLFPSIVLIKLYLTKVAMEELSNA